MPGPPAPASEAAERKGALQSPYELDLAPDNNVTAPLRGKIFYDGVFKGDYSLAIVNRQLARALIDEGADLTCHTPETDWQGDRILLGEPALRERMIEHYPEKGRFDVHLRNTWPPATHDMVGSFNAYACFAWEEIELPQDLVDRFNRDLDLVMVASRFVRDAFLHSGVTIPVAVIGEGADHVDRTPPTQSPLPPSGRRRILHVSSGFPRKGADCLIEAYASAFSASDDVELVIKTFPNPDNVIPATLRAFAESGRATAPITVLGESCSSAELVALYRTAAMVVAPSRGEGFGLPLAEAMWLGVPVVTTNYSGQTDFCRPETAWLVDYRLAPSQAHVAGAFSLWAEPSVKHLAQQMRAALDQPELARERSVRARDFVAEHVTWRKVAKRVARAVSAARTPEKQPAQPISAAAWTLDLVSTWNQRCGIATYAQHLFASPTLSRGLRVIHARRILEDALPERGDSAEAASTPSPTISRLWGYDFASLMRLSRQIEQGCADVLWMQHHPGFFSEVDMQALVPALKASAYRARVITLHSVAEAFRGGGLDWIKAFDVAFVHSAADAAALSAAGYADAVVIPHGFTEPAHQEKRGDTGRFTIGSFGFLTPHKNVDLLVLAFSLARRFAPGLRLKLLNCALPNDASRLARATVETLIAELGLQDLVKARFNFVAEDEVRTDLGNCDLIVFPYGASTETATGAARIAMSVDRPILCSRSPVLRDLRSVSHVLKSLDVECIAEALVSLAQNEDLLTLHDYERRRTVAWYAYPRLAERYRHHIERALGRSHEYRRAA